MSKMPRIIRPKGIMSHTNYSKRFLETCRGPICRGRTAIKFARDTEYICPSSLTDILIILTKYFSHENRIYQWKFKMAVGFLSE